MHWTYIEKKKIETNCITSFHWKFVNNRVFHRWTCLYKYYHVHLFSNMWIAILLIVSLKSCQASCVCRYSFIQNLPVILSLNSSSVLWHICIIIFICKCRKLAANLILIKLCIIEWEKWKIGEGLHKFIRITFKNLVETYICFACISRQ